MSSRIATREIREHRNSLSNPRKPNAMKERHSWSVPPPFIITHPDDVERIPIRNANHESYQVLGTMTIWNKYINLGYYIFDDCMQFHKIWKSTAKDSVTQRNKIIWKSFHFHRMHDIPTPAKLALRANKTALPYLKEKEPDFLLATDIEFEEKEFFDACNPPKPKLHDSLNEDSEDKEQEWFEVISKKNRKKSPPTSPSTTPKQTTTLNADHMVLSENTIDDLNQACITPIPPSTPERNETNIHSPEPTPHETDTTNNDTTISGNLHKTLLPPTNKDIDNNYNILTNNSTKRNHAMLTNNIVTQPRKSPNLYTTDDNHDHQTSPKRTDNTNNRPSGHNPETSNFNDWHSTDKSTNTSSDYIMVNDGTLRITVKWKPESFDSIIKDTMEWNEYATAMLQDILIHPTMTLTLAPWGTTILDQTKLLPATKITKDNLDKYKSPKVMNIKS